MMEHEAKRSSVPLGTPLKGRVRILDFLRGVSVVSMVAYHFMFDLVWMFRVDIAWYKGVPGYIWQQSICWVFILVSGAALHYGGHRLRRALVVLGCAVVVSLVTIFIMPEQRVMSGILHLLGVALLLSALIYPVLKKIPSWLGFVVCAVLFLVTKTLPAGYLGFADVEIFKLPNVLYQTPFLFPLGLPNSSFFSGDYFPLLPWLFLFYAGFFGWGLVKNHAPRSLAKPTAIEWVGKHSLIIYMAHQPVAYGLLWVLDYFKLLAPLQN